MKRFELLHRLGLSQPPLPVWATRAQMFWILDCGFWIIKKILAAGFEPAINEVLNFARLPFRHASLKNLKSEIQNKFGGSEGIQTLTGSLQDFYAVNYITNPKNKYRR